MENNNQARDILSEQEVQLFLSAVNSLGSPDNMPVEAWHKILGCPELYDELDDFIVDSINMLMSYGYYDEDEALDKLEFFLALHHLDDVPITLANSYGRYKNASKARKRRDATEKVKKRKIDRWRSEQRGDDGILKRSEGYLCRKYNKAKKALKDDEALKKAALLRWWEKKAYSKTVKKHKKYVRFAKRYNVYSATKQRYFVRQPKARSELKADGEVSAVAPVVEAPKKDLNSPPIKRLTFVRGKPYPAPVNPSPTPAKVIPASSYSLASFFRGIAGHLSYCTCPFVAIKAQITGRK